MKYTIAIEKRAHKFIESQSKENQKRLLISIYKLPEGDIKSLQGFEDLFRLRVGNYRVIFTKQDDILLIKVVNAGNRGQVYKRP